MLLKSGGTSREYLEESLFLNKDLRAADDPEIGSVLLSLSEFFLWSDNLKAAERTIRESLSIYGKKLDPLHPNRVLAELRLAQILLAQNRVNEASALFEKSFTSQQTLYGENSPQVANVLDSLATIRQSQGLSAEAEQLSRKALAIMKVAAGQEHQAVGHYYVSLASHLINNDKHSEAEMYVRQALAVYSETLPPDHQYIASAEHLLGEILLERGQLRNAQLVLDAAMNRWVRTKSAPWRSTRSASALGEAFHRQGHYEEAERHLTV